MTFKTVLGVVAGILVASAPASADVQLSMKNGRVSIVAKDATLRQILTEWARVGKTKIVNIERVPGGPMTIELIDMPEDQALDVLLRPLAGYLAAPRPEVAEDLSKFDRLIVMPTIAAARPAPSNAPPPPVFQPPPQMAPPMDNDVDEPPMPGAPGQNPANPRGPVFNAFPPPQVVNPTGGATGQPGYNPANPSFPQQPPAGQPAAPGGFGATSGVSVPGMIVQPPPQPGQPGQPVRRPGGGLD